MNTKPLIEAIKKQLEQPHYMVAKAEYGCPPIGYWRCFGRCSDGAFECGIGESAEQASQGCMTAIIIRNKELAEAKLKPADVILNRVKNSCRGTKEQDEFNLAVARHLGILKD